MKIIVLGVLIVVMAACTAAPSSYRFEILNPDTEHVKFNFLIIKEKNGQAVIQGSLFHKPVSASRESGHIDISIYNPQGQLLLETTTQYQTPVGSYHAWAYTGVPFRAPLSLLPPPGSLIKLAFHVKNRKSNTQEPHGANVAR